MSQDTVTFRFYGPLNDFLAPHLRQRRFAVDMVATRSVKDAIEAMGVPHPEVDVILVNGRSESFSYRLHADDNVSVFPAWRTLTTVDAVRATGDPSCPVRFAADIHLRKLASLLRLCGFDTELLEHDADVAAAAREGGRVALTRDVGLLKRSVLRHGYWVREIDPERQLTEVVDRFGLSGAINPFSRCLRCNTELVPADAGSIAADVPAQTRACFTEFSRCHGCGRTYWKGSHYERLTTIVDRVRAVR